MVDISVMSTKSTLKTLGEWEKQKRNEKNVNKKADLQNFTSSAGKKLAPKRCFF